MPSSNTRNHVHRVHRSEQTKPYLPSNRSPLTVREPEPQTVIDTSRSEDHGSGLYVLVILIRCHPALAINAVLVMVKGVR